MPNAHPPFCLSLSIERWLCKSFRPGLERLSGNEAKSLPSLLLPVGAPASWQVKDTPSSPASLPSARVSELVELCACESLQPFSLAPEQALARSWETPGDLAEVLRSNDNLLEILSVSFSASTI